MRLATAGRSTPSARSGSRPGCVRARRGPRRGHGAPRRQSGQRAAGGRAPGDHAFLSDFGLTKRTASAGSLTAAGQVVGTVDFIAPQQPRGDPADARADIYALGGLLYQALTGRVPFPCDGDLATMWAYLHEDPPKATRWVPELPASIDDVLARAQLSVGSQSAGGERRIERLLSAHTTFRLQLRSLQAYLIDAICAHSRANPIPLLI